MASSCRQTVQSLSSCLRSFDLEPHPNRLLASLEVSGLSARTFYLVATICRSGIATSTGWKRPRPSCKTCLLTRGCGMSSTQKSTGKYEGLESKSRDQSR